MGEPTVSNLLGQPVCDRLERRDMEERDTLKSVMREYRS